MKALSIPIAVLSIAGLTCFGTVQASIASSSTAASTPSIATESGYLKSISQMEQRYLGSSYDKEPLEKRLTRLEKLVFGEASSGALDVRVTNLLKSVPNLADEDDANSTSYSRSSRGQTSNNLVRSYDTTTGSAAGSSSGNDASTTESYPRIAALEKNILGESHSEKDLSARLSLMEKKVFGKSFDSSALSDRTDKLQAYLEKKKHKKLFTPPPNSEVASEPGAAGEMVRKRSKLPAIVNAVSDSFFGPFGQNTMHAPIGSTLGFGGVRIRNRADVMTPEEKEDRELEQSINTKGDDPAVFLPYPPPKTAKLKTKVAWCEVQIFGRTFTGVHLLTRLQKLNGELEYRPGESKLALMDDVDGLVQATVRQKAGAKKKAIGSKQTRQTH